MTTNIETNTQSNLDTNMAVEQENHIDIAKKIIK